MNHYFIGKLLNSNDAQKLTGKQNYLSRNLPVTNKVINFNTKFAYLGYLDDNTMLDLQDKLNNVFEALTKTFQPFNCEYTQYGISGLKSTKKSVSVLYNNSEVSNVIVPFIRHYTNQITEDDSDFYPHVALLRFDASDYSKVVSAKDKKGLPLLETTFLPEPAYFTVDSIDIMKGTPLVRRSGPSSKTDDMDISVIHRYKLGSS